jgi:hypothetical protein
MISQSEDIQGMVAVRTGRRLRSAVCSTEVMVVAADRSDVDLRCGGAPMLDLAEEPPSGASVAADASGGTQIGKRYVDEAGTIELLCTKSGEGSLAIDGTLLQPRGAKPLPSSD